MLYCSVTQSSALKQQPLGSLNFVIQIVVVYNYVSFKFARRIFYNNNNNLKRFSFFRFQHWVMRSVCLLLMTGVELWHGKVMTILGI